MLSLDELKQIHIRFANRYTVSVEAISEIAACVEHLVTEKLFRAMTAQQAEIARSLISAGEKVASQIKAGSKVAGQIKAIADGPEECGAGVPTTGPTGLPLAGAPWVVPDIDTIDTTILASPSEELKMVQDKIAKKREELKTCSRAGFLELELERSLRRLLEEQRWLEAFDKKEGR